MNDFDLDKFEPSDDEANLSNSIKPTLSAITDAFSEVLSSPAFTAISEMASALPSSDEMKRITDSTLPAFAAITEATSQIKIPSSEAMSSITATITPSLEALYRFSSLSSLQDFQPSLSSETLKIFEKVTHSIYNANLPEIDARQLSDPLLSVNQTLKPINVSLQSLNVLSDSVLEEIRISNKQPFTDSPDNFNNPPKDIIDTDETKKLLTELQNRLYNLSHNLIAPFSDKSEMAKWISYFIVEQILTSPNIPTEVKVVLAFVIAFRLSGNKLN